MFAKLVKTINGIALRIIGQVDAMQNEPVDGTVKYDLVVNRVDESGATSGSKRTYKTALSRQIAAQELVEESRTVGESIDSGDDEADVSDFADQPGITSLVFEDRLLFWRKSAQTPTMPTRIPKLAGKGKLVIRCGTSKGVVELAGMTHAAAFETLDSVVGTLDTSPSTAAVVRRYVAFRRRLVLCAVG